MEYWAKPRLARDQILLFSPTLDASISNDHPVRLLDEMLKGLDWSAWEAEYDGRKGQPPIPPWVMAGVILYGLMRGIRSSRMLEYLCGHNLDFMWLAEGRIIDHTTICKFRTRFRGPLKDLFRQLGKLSLQMGLIRLIEVAFDGTRVKANASRLRTWTAERLEAALKELDALFEQRMAETEQADAAAADNGMPEASPLPPELQSAQARREKLQELLAQAKAADEARRKDGINPTKNPAQIPKADAESRVMPNKEGGYAPNFTPLAAADAANGMIVDCDVIAAPREETETLSAVDRIEESFGRKPGKMLADTAHGTGVNLAGMEERGVDFYTPMTSQTPEEGNPAKRSDPRQPVAEEERPNLPRNDKKKFAKSCFVYDAESDTYYCPTGRPLNYKETNKDQRGGMAVSRRVYRCADCADCVLAGECLDPKAKRGRTVQRDEYEPLRERMAAKMRTPEGKAVYNQRMHVGETPFAVIKSILGVRRFLLRGLEKVRTEWLWVCTAYNIRKLLAHTVTLRAELVKMLAGTAS
jgi:transposase